MISLCTEVIAGTLAGVGVWGDGRRHLGPPSHRQSPGSGAIQHLPIILRVLKAARSSAPNTPTNKLMFHLQRLNFLQKVTQNNMILKLLWMEVLVYLIY